MCTSPCTLQLSAAKASMSRLECCRHEDEELHEHQVANHAAALASALAASQAAEGAQCKAQAEMQQQQARFAEELGVLQGQVQRLESELVAARRETAQLQGRAEGSEGRTAAAVAELRAIREEGVKLQEAVDAAEAEAAAQGRRASELEEQLLSSRAEVMECIAVLAAGLEAAFCSSEAHQVKAAEVLGCERELHDRTAQVGEQQSHSHLWQV